MSEVRVRFAPSPTGFFHIGGARTALFNWLYARKTGGTFVLRIEDTDRERNLEAALGPILEGLKWLGLNWDEGPEVGGEYGPYFQSERGEIYKDYLAKLQAAGRTYEKDGAIWFKLVGERYTAYDAHLKQEVEKVKTEAVVIDDAIRGRVERREERDFVIVRQDGSPVFHFVNVVDDIAMGITHVIRGEDHLSNTSKHVELFNAFGVTPPKFAHIPLILKKDGPGKMSKRDKGSLVEEYQARHYLPEAVRNYLCLLGWSPKDDREVLPIDEVIELFSLEGINKNNARFDDRKLDFINAAYLRALPVETFCWLAVPILIEAGVVPADADEDGIHAMLSICQEKVRSFDTLAPFVAYFFTEDFEVDDKAKQKVLKKGDPKARLEEFLAALPEMDVSDESATEAKVGALAEQHGVSTGEYIHPVRLAVSGTNVGPSFYSLLRVLGHDRVEARIRRFLEKEID